MVIPITMKKIGTQRSRHLNSVREVEMFISVLNARSPQVICNKNIRVGIAYTEIAGTISFDN